MGKPLTQLCFVLGCVVICLCAVLLVLCSELSCVVFGEL